MSIMGNKLGGAISLSKDMQPARRIEELTAKVSTDTEILTQIEGWAKDTSKKSADIQFTGKVPPAFEGK